MLMQTHEARLDALRKQLAKDGLDGFVIPISDEHMSEYVGAYAQRLEWLTGFGGSAGTAVVLANEAGQTHAVHRRGHHNRRHRWPRCPSPRHKTVAEGILLLGIPLTAQLPPPLV